MQECLIIRPSNANIRRFELVMHKSGTAGRDITCCGVEAPRRPASKCCRGRFAGVTRRGITTGESTSRVSISMDDPAGSSALGMSRGGDNSIRLPSDDLSSQSATASRICVRREFGWTDVTNDMSNIICSWSTAALKNLRRGACSGLLVMTYEFRSSCPDRRAKAKSSRWPGSSVYVPRRKSYSQTTQCHIVAGIHRRKCHGPPGIYEFPQYGPSRSAPM